MEKIIIKNFGGLKDAEIILNKVNVFYLMIKALKKSYLLHYVR